MVAEMASELFVDQDGDLPAFEAWSDSRWSAHDWATFKHEQWVLHRILYRDGGAAARWQHLGK